MTTSFDRQTQRIYERNKGTELGTKLFLHKGILKDIDRSPDVHREISVQLRGREILFYCEVEYAKGKTPVFSGSYTPAALMDLARFQLREMYEQIPFFNRSIA
ncbi:MAG TPA: hypothetical protein VJC07_04670 [Candidatus Nanoarchaeia archaeon]|nr:hypothetical protein [Candidatus Nanoarchaeia archaeon]